MKISHMWHLQLTMTAWRWRNHQRTWYLHYIAFPLLELSAASVAIRVVFYATYCSRKAALQRLTGRQTGRMLSLVGQRRSRSLLDPEHIQTARNRQDGAETDDKIHPTRPSSVNAGADHAQAAKAVTD